LANSWTGKLRRVGAIAADAVRKWIDDRAPSMGAALAYYTAFSLAPLLVIVIAIAGLTVGHDVAQSAILAQLTNLLGDAGGQAVEGMMHATADLGHGVMTLAIGVATLVIGATTAFAELEDDLNRIWKTDPARGSGVWNFLRARLLTFGLVLTIAFLLIVSLVVNAALAALGNSLFSGAEVLMQALDFVTSVAVITVLFAAIYKILPDVDIAWRDVWLGAFVTSVLFAIGRLLIGLYIGHSSVASSFGSAGPFVALMVWIYYSTQIFLMGAEVTYVVAQGHGAAASASKPAGAAVSASKPSRLPGHAVTPVMAASSARPVLAGPRAMPGVAPQRAAEAAWRLAQASAAGLVAGWLLTRIALSRLRLVN